MRTPPHKMSTVDLINWVWEFDFEYYANQYINYMRDNNYYPKLDDDEFKERIYQMIMDEVYYSNVYRDYIKDEE